MALPHTAPPLIQQIGHYSRLEQAVNISVWSLKRGTEYTEDLHQQYITLASGSLPTGVSWPTDSKRSLAGIYGLYSTNSSMA